MNNRIDQRFSTINSENRVGLILFLTVGFPSINDTPSLVRAIIDAGADVVELGVPFSDPLADGPIIQKSSSHALEQGVTLKDCLSVVSSLRKEGLETPFLLMGYYNPILAFGVTEFAGAASRAGVDGVIIADLPVEEADPLRDALDKEGVYLVPLLAPTSTDARIKQACQRARGFIYCVSITGVTGERVNFSTSVSQLLRRVRFYSRLPLAVGFGISRKEHIREIAGQAQAAVVGSGLIRVIDEAKDRDMISEVKRFVKELRR